MSKAEDLTGKEFGYLKVLYRGKDHITISGQKRVRWMCECKLCGTKKLINAQELKRGSTISCGCYQAFKGKNNRNKKICVVCGKEFECPPSGNITCSDECRKKYASIQHTGRKHSEDVKKRLSEKAQERDPSHLQQIQPLAVEAAKKAQNQEDLKQILMQKIGI